MSKTMDVTEWFADHHARVLAHWESKWAALPTHGAVEVCSGKLTVSNCIYQVKDSERYFLRDEGGYYHANWMEFPDTPITFHAVGWIGEDSLEFLGRNWMMKFDSIGQPQGMTPATTRDENRLHGFGFTIICPTKTTDYAVEYILGPKRLYVFNPGGYDKATLSIEKVADQWIARVADGSYLSENQVRRKIDRKATRDVRAQYSEKRDMFAMASNFADATPYLLNKDNCSGRWYPKTDSAKLLKIVDEAGDNWINEAARELGYGTIKSIDNTSHLFQHFDKNIHAVDYYGRPRVYYPDYSNATVEQLKTRFESAIKKAVKEAYADVDGGISYVDSETKEVVHNGKLSWDDR